MFQPIESGGTPRRALVFTPLALVGLIWFRRPRRPVPDAAQSGNGPLIRLVLFSNTGTRLRTADLRKLSKSKAEWRRELDAEAFSVTRLGGTEFAFANRYWKSTGEGIYRCVCCGNALFGSQDKFDSGTGWPSFKAPLAEENIYGRPDKTFAEERVEVLCSKCDAHLGHVFRDGPEPTGLRYCLNSAALAFVC